MELPKQFTKTKTVTLYKPFFLAAGDNGTVDVAVDNDIYGLTRDDALAHLINTLDVETASSLTGKIVIFLVFKLPKEELLKPWIPNSEPYCKNNCIGLAIKDKSYKYTVEYKRILSIDIDIDDKTEIKTLRSVEYEEVDQ